MRCAGWILVCEVCEVMRQGDELRGGCLDNAVAVARAEEGRLPTFVWDEGSRTPGWG